MDLLTHGGLRRGSTEAFPAGVEATALLADPTGTEAILVRDIQGPLPGHQIEDQPLVPFTVRREPVRPIDAECGLFVGWRLRVVLQCLVENVADECTPRRQRADGEALPTLGQGRQDIPAGLLSAYSPARTCGTTGEGGQRRGKGRDFLAAFDQAEKPAPGQGARPGRRPRRSVPL